MINETKFLMGDLKPIASVGFQTPIYNKLQNHKTYFSTCQRVHHTNLINNLESHIFISDGLWNLYNIVQACNSFNIKYLIMWYEGCWPTDTDFDEYILDDLSETIAGADNADEWVVATVDPSAYLCDKFVVFNVENAAKFPDTNYFFNVIQEESLTLQFDYSEYIYYLDIQNDIAQTEAWLDKPLIDEFMVPEEDELSETKVELFNYKYMSSTQLYVTNTENVPDNKNIPVDKIIVPCSGMNQIYYAMTSIDTMKEMVWFDFNDGAIEWTKNHLLNWDGTKFKEYYETEINKFHEKFPLHHDIIYNEDDVDQFMEDVIGYCYGEEGWLKMWDRIRNLKHTFIKLDIVNDGHKVLRDYISKDENVFLQISNIWQYEQNYLNSEDFDVYENWIKLVNMAKKNSKNLWLSGDSPYGKHYYRHDMSLIGSIY
jgi:hypothetical protein